MRAAEYREGVLKEEWEDRVRRVEEEGREAVKQMREWVETQVRREVRGEVLGMMFMSVKDREGMEVLRQEVNKREKDRITSCQEGY